MTSSRVASLRELFANSPARHFFECRARGASAEIRLSRQPGNSFTVGTINFMDNGTMLRGVIDFFSSSTRGGFDILSGNSLNPYYWALAGGPPPSYNGSQLYRGVEGTPVGATFALAGYSNHVDS